MHAPILDQIELPNSLGTVTLFDWMAEEVRDGRNLIRTDPEGRELWRAEPAFFDQGQKDCFVQMAWDGEVLTASTWSCFRVSIDLATGATTTLEFTK